MNLRRENTNWYLTMIILRKQYYTNIKGADDILRVLIVWIVYKNGQDILL